MSDVGRRDSQEPAARDAHDAGHADDMTRHLLVRIELRIDRLLGGSGKLPAIERAKENP